MLLQEKSQFIMDIAVEFSLFNGKWHRERKGEWGGRHGKGTVCDTAQENVMNTHEETRLFLVVVNQPKNITAISTRQTII